MLEDLERRLAETRQELRRREKLRRTLAEARDAHSKTEARHAELSAALEKEGADVRALEGVTFANLMVSLFGNKDRKLDEEERELARAQLAFDEHREVLRACRAEVETREQALAAVAPDLDALQTELLAEKEALLMRGTDAAGRELLELANGRADAMSELRELEEALDAGGEALEATNEVARQLASASNWGVVDMVGGGFVATMIKHGKLDGAKQAASDARYHLDQFARELRDVERFTTNLEVDLDGMTTFADYFLDGLVFDWIVQSKIQRAQKDVASVTDAVAGVLDELRQRAAAARQQLAELERRRSELLESA